MNPIVRQFAPYAVVVLVAGMWRCSDVVRQRQIGAARVQLAAATTELRTVRQEGASLAKQHAVAVDSFSSELARWQALKQRVRLVPHWDTLPPDTVPGPERVVERTVQRPPTVTEILAAADSVISRCSIALTTCDARVQNLLEQIVLLNKQLDATRTLIPSSFTTSTRSLRDAGIGYAACRVQMAFQRRN